VAVCLQCGQENPEGFRFCGGCGSALSAPPPERRKPATLVFCDLSGSTSMGERLDAEAVRELMSRYFDEMSAAIGRHGGTVEKFIGDAVVAIFGVPVAHEDDALRAVRAASEMQARAAVLNEELERRYGTSIRLRVGVNTGQVIAGDANARQTIVTGDAVNVAARLEQAAQPGDVLLGEKTWQLVKDVARAEAVPPISAKGKSLPVRAYRLLDVGSVGERRRAATLPLLGRGQELAALEAELDRVLEERRGRMVTIVGEPGIGKTRLVDELATRARRRATVVTGRCLAYGEGITYWPLREIVTAAAGVLADDAPERARERLTTLLADVANGEAIARLVGRTIGLEPGQASVQEIAWSIRRVLEALARDRPLLVVLDDLHWAEPMLLDLLAAMPERVAAPVLVVCLARPDLIDQRPDWPVDLRLSTLDADDARDFAAALLGSERAADATEELWRAAGGNPLYLEELAAAVNSQRAIPPSLEGLLAARLDALPEPDRATLERGAVEGEVFHRAALDALAPTEPALDAHLERLVARDLLSAAVAAFEAEAAFRFHHGLLRDAAYEATAKRLRARWHAAFGDWLEARVGARLPEYEEIVGYHFEQAHRYLTELGPVDEQGSSYAARGGLRLRSAGERAADRGDARAAANLLVRAAGLLAGHDRERSEALLAASEVLTTAGDYQRAEWAVEEIEATAKRLGDDRLAHRARLERVYLGFQMQGGEWDPQASAKTVDDAVAVLTHHADDRGLARAWRIRLVLSGALHTGEVAVQAAEAAAHHAARAGDRGGEIEALAYLLVATAMGPDPPATYARRREAIARRIDDAPALRAACDGTEAVFAAMVGRFDDARSAYGRSLTVLDELGMTIPLANVHVFFAGYAETLAGDWMRAEAQLRAGYEIVERLGERLVLASAAGRLALVCQELGRWDDAERYIKIAEETAAANDFDANAVQLAADGLLHAHRGDSAAAIARAEEAVTAARIGDDLNVLGWTLEAQARGLVMLGRPDAAVSVVKRALEVYGRKGNSVAAARASEISS
jgi:class 3 adenylate cyclase